MRCLNSGGWQDNFRPISRFGPALGSLRLLGLVACGLDGQIPQWIGQLPKLEALAIGGNFFTGPLPQFVPDSPLIQLQVHPLPPLALVSPDVS